MIPDGWQKVPLVRLAVVQTGVAKGNGKAGVPVVLPYLRVANVQDGYLDLTEIKHIRIDASKVERYSLRYGDVLLTEGGDFDKLGRGCMWRSEIKGCLHQNHVFAVRTDREKLLPQFLSYQTASDYGKSYFLACSKQSTNLASINSRQLKGFPVLLPPIEEQEAITKALSIWDRAIEKAEALIKAKERRKAGLMQRLLTGKVRFGEFVGEAWKEVPLGTLFEPITDTVGDKDIPPYSISAGIGFVSQREKWGKDIAGRQYANYTYLRKGEFAYNKGNSKKYQCGCAYLLRDQKEISVPNVFISFRPKSDKISADFYEHFFIADYHARELKRYITSGARSDGLLNLNKKDFFKINVPCPSPREQEAIAKVLNAAVAEIDEHRNQLAALKEQKKGLMQQLLTGKVRVKS